jgi:nitroreductase
LNLLNPFSLTLAGVESVDDAIRGRRSARRFTTAPVTAETVRELVDLARHAPSSMNGQPWLFVVVRDRAMLRRLADIKNAHCPPDKRDYPADFVADAPVLIAIGVDRARAHGRGRESGALAAATLLLAAQARGLAGVYLTAYNDGSLADELRVALDLGAAIDPIALVPLGYPAESAPPKVLRPLDELMRDRVPQASHAG